MRKIELDKIDKKLLNRLQIEFPLVREPFAHIAEGMGMNEEDIIERVERLKQGRVIRYIGPIFDARSLGYDTTLVAMRVPANRLADAALAINAYPGISHNYQRDHYFNMWFTLTLPADMDRAAVLQVMNDDIGPEEVLDLPALKRFKARAFFDLDGSGYPSVDSIHEAREVSAFTVSDWAIIVELQDDLPLVRKPFDRMAKNVGMGVNEFLTRSRLFKERGVMRRYNASMSQASTGFSANAMVCWAVPPGSVARVCRRMSAIDEVSHCYERQTYMNWTYNVYTMVHARTKRECRDIIRRIAAGTGVDEYEALFTVKEFKKERVRFSPPGAGWMAKRYYPISLDISGRRCIVVGGGEVALRKVRSLLEHGAVVQVISPDLCTELKELLASGRIMGAKRAYEDGDLLDAFVVIAATDDVVVNKQVADEAARRRALVNVVDMPNLSNFIVPSYLRRGDLTVAVSTGGRSPALARRIREELEKNIGDEYALLTSMVGQVRSSVKQDSIVVSGEDWQAALDLDVLVKLLREDRYDEAKQMLADVLRRPK